MEKVEQFEYCELYDEKENKKKYFIKNIFNFWHFASFDNLKQVEKFFKKFNIKKTKKITDTPDFKSWNINKSFKNAISFWCLKQVPNNATPIKALSNGSIVDCYYTIRNNVVVFYRPNPNAKAVYKPLTIAKHLYYYKNHGTY